jgi:hypothetical protein
MRGEKIMPSTQNAVNNQRRQENERLEEPSARREFHGGDAACASPLSLQKENE